MNNFLGCILFTALLSCSGCVSQYVDLELMHANGTPYRQADVKAALPRKLDFFNRSIGQARTNQFGRASIGLESSITQYDRSQRARYTITIITSEDFDWISDADFPRGLAEDWVSITFRPWDYQDLREEPTFNDEDAGPPPTGWIRIRDASTPYEPRE